MLDALDGEVWEALEPFATFHDDMGSIPSVEIPWSNVPAIEAALRTIGIELIERQDQIEQVQPW